MRFVFIALAVASSFLGPPAWGRDIYVDNVNGDDHKGGQSPVSQGDAGGPCRTLAKALRVARKSDRIVLANTGVPYRECVTLQGANHSGDEIAAFQIVGNGATLDGTISLVDADWEHVKNNIYRTQPKRGTFQQFFLNDKIAPRRQPAAGDTPKLAEGEWCLWDGWIYFRAEKDRLPQTYHPSCCGHPVALTLYDVHDVVIEGLTIRGYQLDGVNAHDTVRRTDLFGLTSVENGRSGFSVGGASRVRIDSCTARGNGVAQIRTEGFCIIQTIANQLDPATAPAILREGGKVIAEE